MTKGRPKLPESERLVSISLRLPQHLVDWYDRCGAGVTNRSAIMRRALEDYAFPDEDSS
jgi:metal-responsive CopG/Arc/MetJ family transcriptional regulator